ncbi:MAG: hypothetical protein SPL99_06315 [Catonella sp.]|jgi:polyhydroxyalkanoate synthesis regulator phasin|nr:hypothetical protein [Catonella sp.]MDY6356376.1 hypothetical protein [Catonella sp.]
MELTDGIKNLMLAGIGAVATGYEKSTEVLDELVKKGELTVDQGKALNQELKHKAEEAKANAGKKDYAGMVKGMSKEDLEALKAEIAKAEENK